MHLDAPQLTMVYLQNTSAHVCQFCKAIKTEVDQNVKEDKLSAHFKRPCGCDKTTVG